MNFANNKLDYIITAVAAVLFLASTFLVVDDRLLFKLNSDLSGLTEVGTLEHKDNDVRRRLSRTLYWLPIRDSESLFNEDTLFTGNDSTAEVALKGGNSLTIDPQSLIVLREYAGQLFLDIQFGSLTGNFKNESSKIFIAQNGQAINFSGRQALMRISADTNKKLSVDVLSGQIQAQGAQGISDLVQNQKASLTDGTLTDMINLPVVPSTPQQNDLTWLSPDNSKVKLSWTDQKATNDYIVEIAKDKNFKYMVHRSKTTIASTEVDMEGKTGLFYWRVRSLGANKAYEPSSPVTSFKLLSKTPPQIIYPQKNAKLYILKKARQDQDSLQTSISFAWIDPSKVNQYQLQLSTSPDFKNVIHDKLLEFPEATLEDFKVGQYFWRVRLAYPQPEMHAWTEPHLFDVEVKNLSKPLASPQIATPDTQTYFVRYAFNQQIDPKTNAETIVKRPVAGLPNLQWNPQPDADHYVIEFAKDISFAQTEVSNISKKSSYLFTPTEPGEYYWRVKGIDLLDQPGAYSRAQKVNIKKQPLAPPLLTEKLITHESTLHLLDRATAQQNIETLKLQWQPVQDAKEYELTFSKDKNFSSFMTKRSTTETLFSLEEQAAGNYYWRVAAVDPESDLGLPSETGIIQIVKAELTAPIITEKQIIKTLKKEDFQTNGALRITPALAWSKVELAADYELEMSQDPDFKDIVLTQKLRQLNFNWSKAQPGEFFWRVRAVGGDGSRGQPSQPGLIRLAVAPLEITSPGSYLEKVPTPELLKKSPKPVKLSWNGIELAKYYEVLVADNQEFQQAKNFIADKTSYSYSPPRDGAFYWKVRPLNQQKRSLGLYSDAKVAMLTRKVGLDTPTPTSPIKNESYRILKHLPNLVILEWKAVSDAAAYRVELSLTEDFSSPLVSDTSATNAFLVGKDTPQGKVFWRVRAESGEVRSEWSVPHSFMVQK